MKKISTLVYIKYNWISILRKILTGLLVLLILIQFIRPTRNNGQMSSVNDITHYVKVPDTVMQMLKTCCYDCHSNQTVYPWYTNINPVGLWINSHVNDGKWAINFSDLSMFDKKKLDPAWKALQKLQRNMKCLYGLTHSFTCMQNWTMDKLR